MRELFKMAKGKYVATCEGDDYWTDRKKLQKQVSFLEENHAFSYCFHDYDTLNEATGEIRKNASLYHTLHPKVAVFEPEKILLGPFVASTLTLVFRNNIQRPPCFDALPFGDKSIEKLLAFYGNGYFINESMACYRNHIGGISKNTDWKKSMRNRHDIEQQMFNCLKQSMPGRYSDVINVKLRYGRLLQQKKTELLFRNFPTTVRVIGKYAGLRERHYFDKIMLFARLFAVMYLPQPFKRYSLKLHHMMYRMFRK